MKLQVWWNFFFFLSWNKPKKSDTPPTPQFKNLLKHALRPWFPDSWDKLRPSSDSWDRLRPSSNFWDSLRQSSDSWYRLRPNSDSWDSLWPSSDSWDSTVSLGKGFGSNGNQHHKHTASDKQSHTLWSHKMQRTIMKYFQSSWYQAQKPAFPSGNKVVSVTTESANLDLQIRQNIPSYIFSPCLAVWLCLKMGYENTVLVRLLQIGAMDLTVTGEGPPQVLLHSFHCAPPKDKFRVSPSSLLLLFYYYCSCSCSCLCSCSCSRPRQWVLMSFPK